MRAEFVEHLPQMEQAISANDRDAFKDHLESLSEVLQGMKGAELSNEARALGEMLGHSILRHKHFALWVLRHLGEQKPAAMRLAATRAVAIFGREYDREMVEFAYALADDSNGEVRDGMSEALGEIVGEHKPGFLVHLMERWVKDEKETIRRVPTIALLGCAREHAWDSLGLIGPLASDESERVRMSLVKFLRRLPDCVESPAGAPVGPALVIATLERWLEYDDDRVRWVAAAALGSPWVHAQLDRGLELLKKLGSAGDKNVRDAVASSIAALAATDSTTIAKTVGEWFQSPEPEVKNLAKLVRKKANL
ncbi:MAG: hypothetical protein RL885_26105 [Planctomycetota bacterium]